MEIGMSAAAFYGLWETEEQALQLRHYPIDCCEVFLTHSEYTAEFGKIVKKNLNGIPCRSIHPKGTQFEPDIFGRSPRQRQDALNILEGVLCAGEAIGAKYYVMHGPGGPVSRPDVKKIHMLTEQMERMQVLAQEHGMEILWENVSWAALRTQQDVTLLKQMMPQMRFVLDIKQAQRAHVAWQDMLHAMGDKLAHVHLLDWHEDGKNALPGQGTVDFTALMRMLKEVGYQGACVLEPYSQQGKDRQRLVQALEFLHKCHDQA